MSDIKDDKSGTKGDVQPEREQDLSGFAGLLGLASTLEDATQMAAKLLSDHEGCALALAKMRERIEELGLLPFLVISADQMDQEEEPAEDLAKKHLPDGEVDKLFHEVLRMIVIFAVDLLGTDFGPILMHALEDQTE